VWRTALGAAVVYWMSRANGARRAGPEMLLSAEEDRENPDIVFFFNLIEPDDGPSVVPALRPSVF
jgi:hypothetical protein